MLFSLSITFLQNYVHLQALTIILSTIFVIAILGSAHPYQRVSSNYHHIASESVIIVVMDLLLFSSDPAVTVDDRKKLGFSLIAILGLSIAKS